MNKYLITSLIEASLLFNTVDSAKQFANKYGFGIVAVYYLDGHTPKMIGYGVTNENETLLGTKDFTWI